MKKVELLITLEHPKGNIEKGTIYNWNEDFKRFEYKENGIVIGTVNLPMAEGMPSMFKLL